MYNPKKSLMFGFVTGTWNPIIMRCDHACTYCYAEPIKDKLMVTTEKYNCLTESPETVKLVERELDRTQTEFRGKDFIFVESMGDLFSRRVPERMIYSVLKAINVSSARYLLLTKNPQRMVAFADDIPKNCVVGITVETNRATTRWSKAPLPFDRIAAFSHFLQLDLERFVCAEPLMDFDLYPFAKMIHQVKPKTVAIGYDNHNHQLPEPYLSRTQELIDLLRTEGIEVYAKTLREKWDAR